jgi:HSP20 family protein
MPFFNITSIKSQSQNSSSGDPSELPTSALDEGQLAVDVLETKTAIIVIAPLAGVAAKEIRVTLSDDVLTISGARRFPKEYIDEEKFFVRECYWGEFSRAIALPAIVDSEQVKARFHEGILRVEIPKVPGTGAKIIAVEGDG